jgi:hypothetical protein
MSSTVSKLAVLALGIGAVVADSVSASISMIVDGFFVAAMVVIAFKAIDHKK